MAPTSKKNTKKTLQNTESAIASVATDSPANADDVVAAADLMQSNAHVAGKVISSRFIDAFATGKMQRKLLAIAPDVSSFSGCDVHDAIKLANEGAKLLGTYERLQNSMGRVRQRLVQINKRLNGYRGSFVQAQRAAAPGGPVAKGLAGLAGLRDSELTVQKAKRTRTKNKQKKAKGSSAPPAATAA